MHHTSIYCILQPELGNIFPLMPFLTYYTIVKTETLSYHYYISKPRKINAKDLTIGIVTIWYCRNS